MSATQSTEAAVNENGAPPVDGGKNSRVLLAVVVAVLILALALVPIFAIFLVRGTGDEITTDSGSEVTVASTEVATTTAPSSAPEPSTTESVPQETTTVAPTTTGDTATTIPPAVDNCSASGMTVPRGQPELSDEVAATRSAIIEAALSCDYDALASLVSDDFVASLGGSDSIELWRAQEADGLEPMSLLVGVLSLPHATITSDDGFEDARGPQTRIVWPSAATYGVWDEIPAADRGALSEVYTTDEIRSFELFGSYAGYRTGIDPDGQWRYFVAGD
jgi:hypothetical protein